jgi:hypothetical protein
MDTEMDVVYIGRRWMMLYPILSEWQEMATWSKTGYLTAHGCITNWSQPWPCRAPPVVRVCWPKGALRLPPHPSSSFPCSLNAATPSTLPKVTLELLPLVDTQCSLASFNQSLCPFLMRRFSWFSSSVGSQGGCHSCHSSRIQSIQVQALVDS